MSGHDSGAWRIGRLAGADILVRPSLLLMSVVLVVIFEPRFQSIGGANPYLLAAVFVVALYVSVFLHEVAHLIAARAYGMPVPSVTLHLLGGETHIDGPSRTPAQELITSIVGPVASLAVGGAALWASDQFDVGVTRAILWSVGVINVLVALFNLLPALPLDGGRVLRSLVWWITGSEVTGITVAGWLGRIAAVGFLLWGLLTTTWDDSFALARLAFVAIVAWFLWKGSSHAIHHSARAAKVEKLHAAELMRTEQPPSGSAPISSRLRGRDLLIAMAENPAETYALVDDVGAIVGTLHATDVDHAYREAR